MGIKPIKAAVVLSTLLLIAGAAVWLGSGRLWRPKLSSLASAEFQKADGSEELISLPGVPTLIEQMFPGFRKASAGKRIPDRSGASWIVKLTDTDGSQRQLVVRRHGDNYVWLSNKIEHPVTGDIDLVLAARKGIELLSASHSNSGIADAALQDAAADALGPLFDLARTRNPEQRVVAMSAMTAILSPRYVREKRLAVGHYKAGKILNAPLAIDHPRAAEIRDIALGCVREAYNGNFSAHESYWLGVTALDLICELADQDATNSLAEILRSRADADYQAEKLMEAIECIYGLPFMVEPLFFCPTGESAASKARAAKEALVRRRERRSKVLEWHDQYRNTPEAERLERAIAVWEPIINARHPYTLTSGPFYAPRVFRGLLRHGDTVVPMLKAAQSRVPDTAHKACYEFLIVLITGQLDEAIIAPLANGTPQDREIARQISALAEPN